MPSETAMTIIVGAQSLISPQKRKFLPRLLQITKNMSTFVTQNQNNGRL